MIGNYKTLIVMRSFSINKSKAWYRSPPVGVPSRLTGFWFRAKLAKGVGDLKPRGFEVDEDVALGPNSGIAVKGPGRDTDDARSTVGTGAPPYRVECPSIPWARLADWRLVGSYERLPADPFEFRRLKFQFG
jgi:hypothetical protein